MLGIQFSDSPKPQNPGPFDLNLINCERSQASVAPHVAPKNPACVLKGQVSLSVEVLAVLDVASPAQASYLATLVSVPTGCQSVIHPDFSSFADKFAGPKLKDLKRKNPYVKELE